MHMQHVMWVSNDARMATAVTDRISERSSARRSARDSARLNC